MRKEQLVRRILAMALVLCLGMALLSGCSGKKNSEEETEETQEQTHTMDYATAVDLGLFSLSYADSAGNGYLLLSEETTGLNLSALATFVVRERNVVTGISVSCPDETDNLSAGDVLNVTFYLTIDEEALTEYLQENDPSDAEDLIARYVFANEEESLMTVDTMIYVVDGAVAGAPGYLTYSDEELLNIGEIEEIVVEEETEPETETDSNGYSYNVLSQTMYTTSRVNVRAIPDTDGERLATLDENAAVTVTGQCIETGWYRVDWNGTTGYVSNDYLVLGAAEEETEAPATTAAEEETTAAAETEETTASGEETHYYVNGEEVDEATYEAYMSTMDTSETENASYSSSDYERLANEVISLVNETRASNGLSALSSNSSLMSAAQKRAEEQATLFGHTRPDGTSCFTVFAEYGYSYKAAGENCAKGQTSASQVMENWMSSEGHSANILSADYTEIGVGVYYSGGNLYWVQLFGTN